ncbi:MAG: hexitol phosphatase HxpB [Bacteroidetes bacterium]|nr:hexitol phosphatase HxpB [Bacteroidota bacterium]
MINAAIFDMDGLLVDSEPWWRVAERNVFGKYSTVPTEEDFEKMMGNRIQDVIRKWYDEHPWKNFSPEETKDEIVNEVFRLVSTNARLLPGVNECLHFFSEKKIPIALASSSPLYLINQLMSHFGLLKYFHVVHSAEFEKNGKPSPDVFLSTAKLLHVNAKNCIVFEDSFNGVLAAKLAKMKCVAVPAKEYFHDPKFDIADMKLGSLEEFNLTAFAAINDFSH